ncbi:MAG: hypothetical protein WCF92_02690 [bacterium]
MNNKALIWISSVLAGILLILTVAIFIGQSMGWRQVLKLSVSNVTAGADAKVSVVKAKGEVTVAKIKADETVKVGLAENNADMKISRKIASDAVDTAKNVSVEAATLKAKLEKAQLEKDAAAQEQLNEAKRQLEVLREKLSRKPEIILVQPTACATPAPVEFTPVAEAVAVEPARTVVPSQEAPRQIVGGPRGWQNPQNWQTMMKGFLWAANAKGDQFGIATFQAALNHRLSRDQANFLRELANRSIPRDRAYILQAIAASSR